VEAERRESAVVSAAIAVLAGRAGAVEPRQRSEGSGAVASHRGGALLRTMLDDRHVMIVRRSVLSG